MMDIKHSHSHSDNIGDTTLHVEPLVLWQCACARIDLPKRDYQHLMTCINCMTLADAIADALYSIEKTLSRQHPRGGAS